MKDAAKSPRGMAIESSVTPSSDHCSTTASDSEELFPFSMQEMASTLGKGPMRFAPKHSEDPVPDQASTISTSCSTTSDANDASSSDDCSATVQSSREKTCCRNLKRQWEASNSEVPITYEMYLRTIENKGDQSPEYIPFGLSIDELEQQLLTEVSTVWLD